MNNLVETSVDGCVAHITLNRPVQSNALDRATADALLAALTELDLTGPVRALALTGRGRHFCVGGDLAYFADNMTRFTEDIDYMVGVWCRVIDTLAAMPVPVVVGAQGGVGGGGLGLLWAADHVVAGDNIKLAAGFSRLGLSGDGASTWYLPRLIGMRRAKQLMLENRAVSAEEALAWGLVNVVVAPDKVLDETLATARRLGASSLTAFAATKRLLAQSAQNSLSEQLAAEHRAMVACAGDEAARAAITAFINGQAPEFAPDSGSSSHS